MRGRLRLQTARARIFQGAVATGQCPDPGDQKEDDPRNRYPKRTAEVVGHLVRPDHRVEEGRTPDERQREPTHGEDQLNGGLEGLPNKQRAQSRQHEEVEQEAHPPGQWLHWLRRRGDDGRLINHGGIVLEPTLLILNIGLNEFLIRFRQVNDAFYQTDDPHERASDAAR